MENSVRGGFVAWIALALLLLSCPEVYGLIGDCDNNGSVGVGDLTFVISYLNGGAPPVNYADCDCDGFPGVNLGDALQIVDVLYGSGSFYPWPGPDLIAPARTGIMVVGKVNGTTLTKCSIFINNPTAIGGGLSLPFSFAAGLGEADLDCAGITINPMFSAIGSSFNNTNKTFLLTASSAVPATTNWERLCDVSFVPDILGSPGAAQTVDPTPVGRYFPLIVAQRGYAGVNFIRMLFPRFIPNIFEIIGDVNCDGSTNISDAVYLIAYIFASGNPPGDPDGDGVPDCPPM